MLRARAVPGQGAYSPDMRVACRRSIRMKGKSGSFPEGTRFRVRALITNPTEEGRQNPNRKLQGQHIMVHKDQVYTPEEG